MSIKDPPPPLCLLSLRNVLYLQSRFGEQEYKSTVYSHCLSLRNIYISLKHSISVIVIVISPHSLERTLVKANHHYRVMVIKVGKRDSHTDIVTLKFTSRAALEMQQVQLENGMRVVGKDVNIVDFCEFISGDFQEVYGK